MNSKQEIKLYNNCIKFLNFKNYLLVNPFSRTDFINLIDLESQLLKDFKRVKPELLKQILK